jgi:glutamate synthase (NADPH/NADH) small chain
VKQRVRLNVNRDPVGIKSIELFTVDKGMGEWLDHVPQPAATKTGKKVAVVGSGPAGLAACPTVSERRVMM